MTQEEYKHKVELMAIQPLVTEADLENIISSDGPDIIALTSGKKIGVEVTRCQSEDLLSKGKVNYSRNEQIAHKALVAYNAKLKEQGQTTAFVAVNWNEKAIRSIPPKVDYASINNQIASEIDAFLRDGMDAECDYITSAELMDFGIENGYIASAACWEEPIKERCIIDCVRKKEGRLPIYQQKKENQDITEYWLVIHFMHDISKNINTFVLSNPIATPYSRIYLTQYVDIKRIK